MNEDVIRLVKNINAGKIADAIPLLDILEEERDWRFQELHKALGSALYPGNRLDGMIPSLNKALWRLFWPELSGGRSQVLIAAEVNLQPKEKHPEKAREHDRDAGWGPSPLEDAWQNYMGGGTQNPIGTLYPPTIKSPPEFDAGFTLTRKGVEVRCPDCGAAILVDNITNNNTNFTCTKCGRAGVT